MGRSYPPPGFKGGGRKKGRGFFGEVGHFFTKTGENIYEMAVSSPAGVWDLLKAGGLDVYDLTRKGYIWSPYSVALAIRDRDPYRLLPQTALGRDIAAGQVELPTRMARQGEGLARGSWETLKHPLRDPGYTLALGLGFASGGAGLVARGAAGAGALRAGGGLGAATRAVREVSKPKTLALRAGGDVVEVPAARSVLARTIQRQINTLRNRFPDAPLPVRTQSERVGKVRAKEREIAFKVATSEAEGIRYRGRFIRKMSPKGMAMRAAAIEVPLEVMIAKWKALLPEAPTARIASDIAKQIEVAEKAKRYVRNVPATRVVLYHVASKSKREQILREGLRVPDKKDIAGRSLGAGDVHFWTSLELAQEWAKGRRGTQDIWRVNASKLAPKGDRFGSELIRLLPSGVRAQLEDFPPLTGLVPEITDPKLAALFERTGRASLAEDVRIAEAGLASAETLAEGIQTPGRYFYGAKYLPPTAARLGLETPALAKARAYEQRLAKAVDRAEKRVAKEEFPAEERKKIAAEGAEKIAGLTVTGQGRLFRPSGSERLETLRGAHAVAKERLQQLEAAAARRVTPTGVVGAEEFSGGQFHVGEQFRPGFVARSLGLQGDVLNVGRRPPSRLTHPSTGYNQRTGRLLHDVPRIVAENILESERVIALVNALRDFYARASETPEGIRHPVAMKAEELFGEATPQGVRDLLIAYRQGAVIDETGTSLLAMAREDIRSRVFPNIRAEEWSLDVADAAPWRGIRWIERDLLGGLHKPLPGGPETRAGKLAVGFVDSINNAAKTAILYLKPAYIVPNVIGNTFLIITQQGWAAPLNIADAVRLHRRLGPEDTLLVDNLAQQGIMRAMEAPGGIGAQLMNVLANAYGQVVDVRFRRASILYEARRELGPQATWEDFRALLHDPDKAEVLRRVTERANRALIDYADLTPFERSTVRRVMFFYPWFKGSTRYAADYPRDHPQQAALLSQLGKQGEEKARELLGDRPSWGRQLMPVGGSRDYPLVSNLVAAGILSQPAELGAVGYNFFAGRPQGPTLGEQLTPFAGATLAAITGRGALGRNVPRGAGTFFNELYRGVPLVTLAERLSEDQSGKVYPMTPLQAWGRFTLGVSPFTASRAKLHSAAAREKTGR